MFLSLYDVMYFWEYAKQVSPVSDSKLSIYNLKTLKLILAYLLNILCCYKSVKISTLKTREESENAKITYYPSTIFSEHLLYNYSLTGNAKYLNFYIQYY